MLTPRHVLKAFSEPRPINVLELVEASVVVSVPVSAKGDKLISYTPLPKAAKPAWAKQLTRQPCLAIYIIYQTSNIIQLGLGVYSFDLGVCRD